MAPALFTCRYCKKPNVARSLQGLKSHISQTPECRARRDEEYSLLNHTRSGQTGSQHTRQQPIENHTRPEDLEENNVPPSNDGDEQRSKRARVDSDDADGKFQSTTVNFIVDYPAEACAGAIHEDSQDGLETRFEKIRHMQQCADNPHQRNRILDKVKKSVKTRKVAYKGGECRQKFAHNRIDFSRL